MSRALVIVDTFLATPFEGGRHGPRIAQLSVIEADECASAAAEAPGAG